MVPRVVFITFAEIWHHRHSSRHVGVEEGERAISSALCSHSCHFFAGKLGENVLRMLVSTCFDASSAHYSDMKETRAKKYIVFFLQSACFFV